MLDRSSWLFQIKTRLGYPVVNLAITDEMIDSQIELSIKKIVPYLNNIEVIETSTKVTTFTDRHIYAVLRVNSTTNFANAQYDSAIYRGFYTVNNKTLKDCALWNYYCNTIQDDMGQIGFRLIGNTLYIDGDKPPYSVEAITDKSINTMTEDYLGWCLDYSVALVKCIEGEIRSKVKITGSPVETNGSDLKNEGLTEKKELEEKLGNSLGLFYATR